MKKAKNSRSSKDGLANALRAAMTIHQSGKIQQAVQLYRAILKNTPNQADALHYLGVAQHQLGKKEDAIVLMRRAIEIDPDYFDAQNNLGNLLKENGQVNEAEQSYRAVIAARPEFALAYNNLGVVLAAQKRFVEAVSAYQLCLALTPDYAQAWHNLGNALKKNEDIDAALSAYKQAILLAPYNASAYQDLGNALAIQKRFDEALSVFQRWLILEPDNPVIHHMIAAYNGAATPQRASDGYVQKTFDSFAESFDDVLSNLDYHAPALVGEKLAQLLGKQHPAFDILDAGCGTGLCAAYLKPYARSLVGVDLSAGMLNKAAKRDNYDKLQQAELCAFLATQPESFNCIVSADTLCYFGALNVFMKTAALALRAGAYLVFTVEHMRDIDTVPQYFLHPHGRYSHKESYVRETMQAAGLQLLDISYVTLRKESDQPVYGLLVAAMK
ncbi:MAG: tetratricopeptide repeat protein [Pseudomonadota bacterium]